MKPLVVAGLLLTVFGTLALVSLGLRQKTNLSSSGMLAPFELQSSSTTVKVGEDVLVSVMLDTSTFTVYVADLNVSFDPQVFAGVRFVNGSMFPANFMLSPGKFSEPGLARIVVSNQPGKLVQSKGTLALLTLKALKPTVRTSISISPKTKVSGIDAKIFGATPSTLNIKVI